MFWRKRRKWKAGNETWVWRLFQEGCPLLWETWAFRGFWVNSIAMRKLVLHRVVRWPDVEAYRDHRHESMLAPTQLKDGLTCLARGSDVINIELLTCRSSPGRILPNRKRVWHIPDALQMSRVSSSNAKGDFTESLLPLSTYWQIPFSDWCFQGTQAVTTLQQTANSAVLKTTWFCTCFIYLENLQNPPKPPDGKQKQSMLLFADRF